MVIIFASKLYKSSLSAQSLPSSTRKQRLYKVCMDYFSNFVLFSLREKKREVNHLWQWIIEIFISTQPYKLCTKRETKVRMDLSRKIT